MGIPRFREGKLWPCTLLSLISGDEISKASQELRSNRHSRSGPDSFVCQLS